MNQRDYDVVIIGGGIHGVGVAQAAAARGYRTLLLEKSRLAAGTSSRSSKLIHGGLRYLESARFSLVRESLRERRILLAVAGDLVRLVPYHIPIYETTSRSRWMIRAGLGLYFVLGGMRRECRFEVLPRRRWGELDGLRTDGLREVFRYRDGQTDDAALTASVMASARSLGAELTCPGEFLRAAQEDGGYRIELRAGDRELECRGRAVVNAAGPWLNVILGRISPAQPAAPIDLVQGTHLTLPGKLHAGIYYTESPRDRRPVFAMPSHDGILVGTTETPFEGDPGEARTTDEEVNYLLETFGHYFPERERNVLGSTAGLRVLPRGRQALQRRSRETILLPDRRREPRLISILGGKLTTYRSTAEKVMARLAAVLPEARRRQDTSTLELPPPDPA